MRTISFLVTLILATPTYAFFASGIDVDESGRAIACGTSDGTALFAVDGPEITQGATNPAIKGRDCTLVGNRAYVWGVTGVAAGNVGTRGVIAVDVGAQLSKAWDLDLGSTIDPPGPLYQDGATLLAALGTINPVGGAIVRIDPATRAVTKRSNRDTQVLGISNGPIALLSNRVEWLDPVTLEATRTLTLPQSSANNGAIYADGNRVIVLIAGFTYVIDAGVTPTSVPAILATARTHQVATITGDKIYGGGVIQTGVVYESTWPSLTTITLPGPKPDSFDIAMGALYGADAFNGLRRIKKLGALPSPITASPTMTLASATPTITPMPTPPTVTAGITPSAPPVAQANFNCTMTNGPNGSFAFACAPR